MAKQTKQKLIDQVQDIVAQIEIEDGVNTKQAMAEITEEFKNGFDGSPLDLFLISKRLGEVADNMMDSELKEEARAEFILRYGNEKNEHNGISITPIESHAKYEYPQDKMLVTYEEDLKDVKERMKPLKKEEKSIKDSIKDRQNELVDDGKATKLSSSKYLRVNN